MKHTFRNSREDNISVYIEVNSVIENLSQNEKNKIPRSLIKSIRANAQNVTIPIYLNKSLDEQIGREALIVLVCLSTKYLFSYEEKQTLKQSLIKNSLLNKKG